MSARPVVLTIVGARPQFIKAAVVSRALAPHFQEEMIHTGQHYDQNMSDIFFEQLKLKPPLKVLDVKGLSVSAQTAQMIGSISESIAELKPQWVLLYGDTTSTLAGAIAAVQNKIPVVHVEAGLRSYDKSMPEEVNRVLTDHISSLLCAPTQQAMDNLRLEQLQDMACLTGDVMFDIFKEYEASLGEVPQSEPYILLTLHRAHLTDTQALLSEVVQGLIDVLIRKKINLVWPIHPRTKQRLINFGLFEQVAQCSYVQLIEPLGYTEFLTYLKHAQLFVTDSGGAQKEAYMLQTPCVTLRKQTEWVETVNAGWNRLIGYNVKELEHILGHWQPPTDAQGLYGDGQAAQKIVNAMKAQQA